MKIETFQLNIPGEITVTFLNYGGIIQNILVPDKSGQMGNVVLGFPEAQDYQKIDHPYFGALVGRYANRIARGKFSLDGKDYKLAINNGPNALHGGLKGFDKVFWNVERLSDLSCLLRYTSPDGEEGYPGKLNIEVTYSLKGRAIEIEYRAVTDSHTILNLTNHSYFNLRGKGTILDHELMLNADRFTEVDETLIPTGELKPVTPAMDFRAQKAIGKDIQAVKGGYDHNYVLNQGELKARLFDPYSGRSMEVHTTQPGIQFYSGNFLDGKLFPKHAALCLETQHFPDSPNHPQFPCTELKAGDVFSSRTIYKFN